MRAQVFDPHAFVLAFLLLLGLASFFLAALYWARRSFRMHDRAVLPSDHSERAYPQSSASAGDDFTAINGIGLAVQQRLRRTGIVTYRQLADVELSRLPELGLADLEVRFVQSNWRERAARLHERQQRSRGK